MVSSGKKAFQDQVYFLEDWRLTLEKNESTGLKIWFYAIARVPLALSIWIKLQPSLRKHFPFWKVFGERGWPLPARHSKAVDFAASKESLFICGCGSGWEVLLWIRHGFSKIICHDIERFDCWPDIVEASRAINPECSVEFLDGDFGQIVLSHQNKYDLVASEALLHHLIDCEPSVRRMCHLLKPGGVFYATYGPLWMCAGGDHYSGRDGDIVNAYNHLLLGQEEYRKSLQSSSREIENLQDGKNYAAKGWFSKLRVKDYFKIFERVGLDVRFHRHEISMQGLRFSKVFPEQYAALKQAGYSDQDLLTKGQIIVATRKP